MPWNMIVFLVINIILSLYAIIYSESAISLLFILLKLLLCIPTETWITHFHSTQITESNFEWKVFYCISSDYLHFAAIAFWQALLKVASVTANIWFWNGCSSLASSMEISASKWKRNRSKEHSNSRSNNSSLANYLHSRVNCWMLNSGIERIVL